MMQPDVAPKVHAFFSQFPSRSYPKGQILVFADENPEHVYYIVRGKVRQYDISYRGEEIILNIFKPPAFFPMSWALNKTPNKYFFKTEEPTDIHIVPTDKTVEFLRANPDALLDLVSRLYRGMDGLLGRIVHLMAGTAKSRLIYELIIETQRFGIAQGADSYGLATTETDIAARSGLTRETVSREMQKLKKAELVKVSKEGIVITSLEKLQKLLGKEI